MRQDLLETAGPQAHVAPPVLVVLPDAEARVDVGQLVLGRRPVQRLAKTARDAGFAGVLMGPGTGTGPTDAEEVAAGDPLGRPALVVFEGASLHPRLVQLMVAHPLELDERFTLYDAVGRPCAAFVGDLSEVPAGMPVCEELPWPEDMGPADVVRLVYDEDRGRAEALTLRGEQAFVVGGSSWHRFVTVPVLRRLADSGRPVAQLELLGLAGTLAVLPLALLGGHLGLVLAALMMMASVLVSRLVPVVRTLHHPATPGSEVEPAGDRLSHATRPLTHAAAMVGLTYGLVAQTDRSGAAALVVLAAGAAATLLSLLQARRLLRASPAEVFALPDPRALARRLDVVLPPAIEGAPLLELAVLVVAPLGITALPWSVLAASAVARLWRWYAGPPQAA